MRIHLLAPALALGALLGACSSTGTDQTMTYGSSTSGTTTSPATAPTSNSSGYAGTANTASTTPGMTAQNATVLSIEPAPGSTMQGSSGTAGTTGGAATMAEPSYRITLRLDDGSTRVVTQQWQPRFTTGDRVQFENDQILTR